MYGLRPRLFDPPLHGGHRIAQMAALIFDIGMHHGHDTKFYLSKGFRVVAIEANPVLAKQGNEKFAADVESDRLRILNIAVAEEEGPVTFWANDQNDDWGTTSDSFKQRNEKAGTTMQPVTVTGRPLQRILDEYGTPYYLKIDVEGSDTLCLKSLRGRELPNFVSIEADFETADAFFEQIAILWEVGYRKFQIINQGCFRWWRCPNPPREGDYVDTRFVDYSTGLFGEELSGEWICASQLVARAKPLLWEQRMFGLNAPHSRSLSGRCFMGARRLLRNPVAWYDIHARQ